MKNAENKMASEKEQIIAVKLSIIFQYTSYTCDIAFHNAPMLKSCIYID